MKLKCNYEIITIGDEMNLVPLDYEGFNGIIRVNEVTADIVALLKEETTEDKIVSEMLKVYKASEDDIRRNVRNVVNTIRDEGLLEE